METLQRGLGILVLVTGVLQSSSLIGVEKRPTGLPNIVVIFADDLGYGDVSCYNPERGKIPTPHIDRLASQGMMFTDAHSSSGVCSPSRYTLLTGRYHWRTRLQKGIVGLWGTPLDRARSTNHCGIAETERISHRLYRQMASRLGLADPGGKERGFFKKTIRKRLLQASSAHQDAWRHTFSQLDSRRPRSVAVSTSTFGTDVPELAAVLLHRTGQDHRHSRRSSFLSDSSREQPGQRQGPALAGLETGADPPCAR